jgi:hypothetical protein
MEENWMCCAGCGAQAPESFFRGELCIACDEAREAEEAQARELPLDQRVYLSLIKRGMDARKGLPENPEPISAQDMFRAMYFGRRLALRSVETVQGFCSNPVTFEDELISLVYDRDEALAAMGAIQAIVSANPDMDPLAAGCLRGICSMTQSAWDRFDRQFPEETARKIAERLSRELPGMVHPPQQHEAWWYFKHLEQ